MSAQPASKMTPSPIPTPETNRTRRPGFLSLWIPPVLYLAAIFFVSSESQPFISPPHFAGGDKVAHFFAYAGLGALLCRAYRGSGVIASAAAWLTLLTASLYGASDEWHQSFVPNRSADPADWLADTLGALLGATAFLLFLRLRNRRDSIR